MRNTTFKGIVYGGIILGTIAGAFIGVNAGQELSAAIGDTSVAVDVAIYDNVIDSWASIGGVLGGIGGFVLAAGSSLFSMDTDIGNKARYNLSQREFQENWRNRDVDSALRKWMLEDTVEEITNESSRFGSKGAALVELGDYKILLDYSGREGGKFLRLVPSGNIGYLEGRAKRMANNVSRRLSVYLEQGLDQRLTEYLELGTPEYIADACARLIVAYEVMGDQLAGKGKNGLFGPDIKEFNSRHDNRQQQAYNLVMEQLKEKMKPGYLPSMKKGLLKDKVQLVH